MDASSHASDRFAAASAKFASKTDFEPLVVSHKTFPRSHALPVPPPLPVAQTTFGSARDDWQVRFFDIVFAGIAFLVLLPVLLLVSLAIMLSSPGPVLFVHHRVGRGGKTFPCLKFRSMVVDSQARLERLLAESPEARLEWAQDQKLRSDPRITMVGAFLRKTSLDELPQLINILAGHMSIVGPRPIIDQEVPRYGPRFAAYCSVRPGLTGLWQVSGRNEVSYDTRVRLDAYYALRKSVLYDMNICFRTVPAVLARRGSY